MKRIILWCLVTMLFVATIYTLTTAEVLTYKFLPTVQDVTTSTSTLPTTAMVGRKYIQIQNYSTTTIHIGDTNVTADTASTGGTKILPYAVWRILLASLFLRLFVLRCMFSTLL